MRAYLICLVLLTVLPIRAQTTSIAPGAKWHQIVLLKSSRAEVEKLIGVSDKPGYLAYYPIEDGSLQIEYSRGFCKPEQVVDWNVAEWTVTRLTYIPFRNRPRFSSLKIDLTRFRKKPPALDSPEVSYFSDTLGVEYTVNEDHLESVELYPPSRYGSLSCKKRTDKNKSSKKEIEKQSSQLNQGAVIRGVVLDPKGQPVAKADVVAYDLSRGSRGPRPRAMTNEKGDFKIEGLVAGTYYMTAEKESEGYADMIDGFHSAGLVDVPHVSLAENQIIEGVILRLAPKSARIVGRIIDAKTKKPIEQAGVTLRRANNPSQLYRTATESKFSVLVPPVPFTIEVEADGYEKWTYSKDGSGKHMDPLQIASGQRKELTISLVQKKPVSPKP